MTTRTPLTDRDLGYLRYLYRKANTPDNWDRSSYERKPGETSRQIPTDPGCCPSEHWDDQHNKPGETLGRADALKSTYALAVIAERTPAWREISDRIFDQLIYRYSSWWGAVDWMTQMGPDPDRASYPDAYRWIIPESQWGNYDVPGWAANGVPPWGVQMDPIAADGMLFYKGFFLVMLGLHRRTTGSERWDKPFDMIRDGVDTFTWTHSAIADKLASQWRNLPEGVHCENTKVWPFCCSGAGLGLQLADNAFGTSHHSVWDNWWAHRDEYWPEPPEGMTNFYYDPVIQEHIYIQRLRAPVEEFWLAAQVPELARRRWDVSRDRAGIGDAQLEKDGVAERVRIMYDKLPNDGIEPGMTWSWIVLAREFGLTELADALMTEANERYEPRWDRSRGEFTWTFGLDEEHPRGQPNALMATATAMEPGAWSRLGMTAIDNRVAEPTVLGVDFPTLALSQAEWLRHERRMVLRTEAMNDEVTGTPTCFRIRGLDEPSRFEVTSPTGAPCRSHLLGGDLLIHTTVGQHQLEVAVGAGGS